MTKDQMIFNHRLSLLSRAKSINNISAACREAGVSRTYYYKWMARFLTYGSQGLYERQRPKPKMPNSTRSDIVEKILNFIKLYPTYGPARIANEIGGMVCPTTVYNILRRRGLSKKIDRLLALEDIPVTVKISPIMARKIYEEKPLLSIKIPYRLYALS